MRRTGRSCRRALIAGLASIMMFVGFGATEVTAAPQAPAPASTLTGESLQSQPFQGGQMIVRSSCNADNSGTVSFVAFGTATGTFPGTFVEWGVLVMGPASPSGSLES